MKDDNVSGRLRRGARVDQPVRLFLILVAALASAATLSFVAVESPMAQIPPSSCGNGFVEPPEQCDPPGSITCPPGSPAEAFLPCNIDCTCPPLPPTTTPTTVAPTTSTTLINHYQCYESKRAQITGGSVTIQDQFGTHANVGLFRPNRLCAPTNKQNEDPGAQNDPDHLRSWQTKFTRPNVLNQTVVNQFGTLVLDVKKPAFLLVPASKSLVANPPPLAQPTVDHFQCYKVKRSRGSTKFVRIPGVTGVDQFGAYSLDLLKPRYLCAPANKSGEDPTAPDHPEHLVCYKTRNTVPKFGRVTAFATDQFGSQALDLIRRIELCVPTLKNPATTTTSTMVATTSTAAPTTVTTSTVTTSTVVVTTSTTSTTLYGSPSRAFADPVRSLLD